MTKFEMTQEWINNNKECKNYIDNRIIALENELDSMKKLQILINTFEEQNIEYHNHSNLGFLVSEDSILRANQIAEEIGLQIRF